mgnify:CR=1 FL=1
MREVAAVFTAFAFLAAVAAEHSAPKPSWTTQAKVVRVIDGDTLEVEIRRVLRVRMLDCWAPESRRDPRLDESRRQEEKAKGQAAKEHLISLANGREVIVSVPMAADGDVSKIWTMGRVLGWVWLADRPEKSLSAQQVEAGHAVTTKPEELR